ncbi:hypothetical protein E3U55_07590 [Filobacillus milosensis]|uniref:Uncharacterized protein n=1 Tax=Filobacillus milosensis TaxID=94137 RepID=A0A4Y8IQF3_9BACI|nr:hypothetical protein E3U55_07590 [Filobacillus milosensis]
MILASIIIFIVILSISIEWPLLKNKEISQTFSYFSLLALGITLTTLYGLDVKLPNPLDAITYLFRPISTGIFNLFK